MESKTCPKCNIDKPMGDFYADRRAKDGRSTWCRACKDERMRAHIKKATPSGEEALGLPELENLRPFDGSSKWMIEVHGILVRAIAQRPHAQGLQAAARAISQLATSMRGYLHRDDLEQRVDRLLETVQEMQRTKDYGTSFFQPSTLRDCRPPAEH